MSTRGRCMPNLGKKHTKLEVFPLLTKLPGWNGYQIIHMWLMGCPNPCKLEQKLECTFLKPFIQVKTKWASKKFSIYAIQSYQLHSKADSAHQGWIGLTAWLVTLNGIGEKFFWCSSWFYMGKRFQKNALPFLFQFARVRAAHQLHVYC